MGTNPHFNGSAYLCAAGHFFVFAFHWAAILYLPLYFKESHLNDAQIGILMSLLSLSTLILIFPLGILADRLNPKHLFLSGASAGIIFSLLMPMMRSFLAMAALMLLAGAAFCLMLISISALFIKQMAEQNRGIQAAIFHTGAILGAGMGAYLCGLLSKSMADVRIFFPLALAYCLGAVILGLFIRSIKGFPFSVLEYRQDLKHGWAWILIFVVAVTASHAGFEHAGYTLLQTEVIGLNAEQVGRAFLYISFWMAAISILAGRLHDRFSRPLVTLGLAMIISGIFMAASGHAKGFHEFIIIRFLHTFGDSFSTVLITVVAATIFPVRRIGGTYAFVLTVNTASYFLFANIGGFINQSMGFVTSFHVSGALLAIGGLLAVLLIRPFFKDLVK
jgi:MFS family permease